MIEPRRVSQKVAKTTKLVEMIIEWTDVDGFEVSQVWYRTPAADPAHLWLQQRFKELAPKVGSSELRHRKEDQ